MDKNDILRSVLTEYMHNKDIQLENDRIAVLNRVSVYKLNVDDYHELLVTEIRADTARTIFRQITEILNVF